MKIKPRDFRIPGVLKNGFISRLACQCEDCKAARAVIASALRMLAKHVQG